MYSVHTETWDFQDSPWTTLLSLAVKLNDNQMMSDQDQNDKFDLSRRCQHSKHASDYLLKVVHLIKYWQAV